MVIDRVPVCRIEMWRDLGGHTLSSNIHNVNKNSKHMSYSCLLAGRYDIVAFITLYISITFCK